MDVEDPYLKLLQAKDKLRKHWLDQKSKHLFYYDFIENKAIV